MKNIKVNSLNEQVIALEAINQYRISVGMASARNPYSWWKYLLAALTYYPANARDNNPTLRDLTEFVYATAHVKVPSTVTSIFANAVNQCEPDAVRREYTKNLPGICKLLGLVSGVDYDYDGKGRKPTWFKLTVSNRDARRLLIANYPEMAVLFEYIDKTVLEWDEDGMAEGYVVPKATKKVVKA
jgi:hypothetical protein